MIMHRVFAATCVGALGLAASTAAQAGSTTFFDNTFANYTTSFVVLSDPSNSVAVSQCPTCGDPAGDALQVVVSLPTGGGPVFNAFTDVGIVDNTFAYNPATQGAISSISTSVDKEITVTAGNYGNNFHPLIEQDGQFYAAGITGTAVGTYEFLSASGLTAASFDQIDPTTGAVGDTHPNFAGDPLLFGVVQETGADQIAGTVETVEFDNLSYTLTAVPEPAIWAMMLTGFGGLGIAMRSRRKVSAV